MARNLFRATTATSTTRTAVEYVEKFGHFIDWKEVRKPPENEVLASLPWAPDSSALGASVTSTDARFGVSDRYALLEAIYHRTRLDSWTNRQCVNFRFPARLKSESLVGRLLLSYSVRNKRRRSRQVPRAGIQRSGKLAMVHAGTNQSVHPGPAS